MLVATHGWRSGLHIRIEQFRSNFTSFRILFRKCVEEKFEKGNVSVLSIIPPCVFYQFAQRTHYSRSQIRIHGILVRHRSFVRVHTDTLPGTCHVHVHCVHSLRTHLWVGRCVCASACNTIVGQCAYSIDTNVWIGVRWCVPIAWEVVISTQKRVVNICCH
jgi:hypothetical protein